MVKKWARGFAESKKRNVGADRRPDSDAPRSAQAHVLSLVVFRGGSARASECGNLSHPGSAFAADVNILDSILILAFSSLFSNLIFFSPMQLGAREGGPLSAVDGLHLTGALGVYTGLITRLRELLRIAVGILLIKIGNKDLKQKNDE